MGRNHETAAAGGKTSSGQLQRMGGWLGLTEASLPLRSPNRPPPGVSLKRMPGHIAGVTIHAQGLRGAEHAWRRLALKRSAAPRHARDSLM